MTAESQNVEVQNLLSVLQPLMIQAEVDQSNVRKFTIFNHYTTKLGLRIPHENHEWFIRFLRARKFDVTQTHDLILKYYQFKKDNRKTIYDELLPSREKNTFEQNIITVLPTRDQAGRRIMVIRIKNWNPDVHSSTQIARMLIILSEFAVYEPITQLLGIQVILDVNEMHEGHSRAIQEMAGKMIDWALNCIPLHIEGIHVVNEGSNYWKAYRKIFCMNKLPRDVRKKIKTYGTNMELLHRYIPPHSLPDIYGGSFPMYTISGKDWDIILECQDHEYKKIDSYGFIDTNVH